MDFDKIEILPEYKMIFEQKKLFNAITDLALDFDSLTENSADLYKEKIDKIDGEFNEFSQFINDSIGFDKINTLDRTLPEDFSYREKISGSLYEELVKVKEAIRKDIHKFKQKPKWSKAMTLAFASLLISPISFCMICFLSGIVSDINTSFANSVSTTLAIIAVLFSISLIAGGSVVFIQQHSKLKSVKEEQNTPLVSRIQANWFNCLYLVERIKDVEKNESIEGIKKNHLPTFTENWNKLKSYVDEFNLQLTPYCIPLEESYQNQFIQSDDLPKLFVIGNMKFFFPSHNDIISPAIIPFPEGLNMNFLVKDEGKFLAVDGIQSLLLRLLISIPPGKLRFTFLDPIGLGQNVAPFMVLRDRNDKLINGRAWTSQEHIKTRLRELSEHIQNVIQKYLQGKFSSIDEYNEQAGEMAEPYQILVVYDFPANFDDESARHLLSIVQNGPRCGVYTIIHADVEQELPYEFDPRELEKSAYNFVWEDSEFVWTDNYFANGVFEIDRSFPEQQIAEKIIKQIGDADKFESKVIVEFDQMMRLFAENYNDNIVDYPGIVSPPDVQDPATWWQGTTTDELVAPIGRAGADKVQCFSVGKETFQHSIIAGSTGSGKSTLLHTLITSLAINYSPDELELYLIDFKKGVEFKKYVTYRLPHARVIAIQSEREFGLSVLQGLNDEMNRRGEIFRSTNVENLSLYRKKTGENLSRILLVVDEFQEFFTDDDKISSDASEILDRLVRQGRAMGVHVLLSSQTLAGEYSLPRSTMDQMHVRIALKCSDADSRIILGDDNPVARTLLREGQAIYNNKSGLIEGNSFFQVAWMNENVIIKYLQQINKLSELREYSPKRDMVVFEGNIPAHIGDNLSLAKMSHNISWSADNKPLLTWIGEPIAVQESLAIEFLRQSGNNFLILGKNEEMAIGMLTSILISLSLQIEASKISNSLSLVNFAPLDSPSQKYFTDFRKRFEIQFEVGGRKHYLGIIKRYYEEVNKRIEEDIANGPCKFLLLFGIQRARELREENDLDFDTYNETNNDIEPNVSHHLNKILREGPELGIHTIIWCDTYSNLRRAFGRNTIQEISMRSIFQVSSEDSNNLIDSSAGAKLGAFRSIFYNEDEGVFLKFRPYGIPEDQLLDYFAKAINSSDRSSGS